MTHQGPVLRKKPDHLINSLTVLADYVFFPQR